MGTAQAIFEVEQGGGAMTSPEVRSPEVVNWK